MVLAVPLLHRGVPLPLKHHSKNCKAVRAAGRAPIYRGDPGYSSKLDADNDGIGCE
ncbi:excalibur calcium-binding domain-containing protein [Bifidobacterium dentium]|uniref:excalibur calcium-binding domain-containing protein n=1 Tax=Bifidobacterium dentium TaxID=1689 RepID=UPI0018C2F3C1|nr:excalibur calcium-binding domain-containing protein [Bifidobacterium dentium]